MVFQWVDCSAFSITLASVISYGGISSGITLDLFFYLCYNKTYLKNKDK